MPQYGKTCVATVTAVALAASGCGSGHTPKPPPLTPAQFKAKANAICRVASRQAPKKFPGRRSGNGLVTTATLVTPYLKKSLRTQHAALTKLQALVPPESQRNEVAELISAHEARIFDLQQALDSARKRDQGGFTTAIQNDQTQDGPRYLRAAKKLGLSDCVPRL